MGNEGYNSQSFTKGKRTQNTPTFITSIPITYILVFINNYFLQLILKKHQKSTKSCASIVIDHYHRICSFPGRFRREGESTSEK
ncbi:hypothetical protein SAMN02746065_1175 [Desulfocicer vacuolatum DSM 3385]|uniref:Uncharacterized protein n=1 Tax=Desulfocicer vacuolatum DSM 3385 TaxID=1121400 RepID=A0A1W2DD67_9BACT|nr:hypothetical protein SAMN02746065_1175 [Desulfocicer vacuolatum DSM 3385]